MNWQTFALLTVLASLTLAGCGGSERTVAVHKTSGTISFENRPIAGAFVVLHSRQPAEVEFPPPRGEVQPDGTFTATTFEAGDGAPAGEYVVTVEWQQIVPSGGEYVRSANLLPTRYSATASSDIVVQVVEGENVLPPIVLRR